MRLSIQPQGEISNEKIVCSFVAMSFVFCLMLSSGFAGAADMDKGMMMDNGKMMMMKDAESGKGKMTEKKDMKEMTKQ